MAKTPRNVDAYIQAAPRELRARLTQLRRIILTTVPKAEERISYGMPYYSYKGRLVYFELHKNHIGLYIPTPVLAEHKSELEAYETTSATLRLPLDQKLPVTLIRKLIRARMEKNEAAQK